MSFPSRKEQIVAFLRRRWPVVAGVLAAVAATVIAIVQFSAAPGPQTVSQNLVGEVRRGPMVVSVNERAEIEAERKKVISNELKWSVTILKIVPDGTRVKEGDVIIQFECKELGDAIAKQQLEVASAENLLLEAREKLKMAEKELSNKVEKAKAAVIDAEEDLKRHHEGEYPVKLSEAKSDLAMARGESALVQQDLEFMTKANAIPELKDSQPYSAKQLEAKQLEVDRKKLVLDQATSKLDMFIKYDAPKLRRKLETALRDAKLDLEKAQMEEKTGLMVARANEQSRDKTYTMNKAQLDDLMIEQGKLTVTADRDGLVIYKTSNNPWRSSNVDVAVGEKINSRQQLMIIPDLMSLRVHTRVTEAVVNQVQPGAEAYVKLDAMPDVTFTGRVERVNTLPDSQNWWGGNSMRVYTVIVALSEEDVRKIKPEMTGKVEIVLSRLPEVTYAPIAAVFSEQQQTFCWRKSGLHWEKTPIKVGRMNDTSVEVLDGLSAGDRVMLTPPEGTIVPPSQQAPGQQEQAQAQAQPAEQPPPAGNGANGSSGAAPKGGQKPRRGE